MAFADFNWATDVNYPAGAATWSGTATKVAPAAGVQADGFQPTDRPPAQWINWLFNSVVTSGQALETLVGNATLQRAWDRSEAIGAATHINVGTQDLVIGGTAGAILTAENASRRVTLPGELSLRGLLVPDIRTGTWSVALAASVSGASASSSDITSSLAMYHRVGNVVTFSIALNLNASGYTSSAYVFTFIPPFTTNFTNSFDVIGTLSVTDSSATQISADAVDNTIALSWTLSSPGANVFVRAHGQFIIN